MNRKPNLAVVGATGVVGTTILKVLEERDFPIDNLYIMTSAKSAGKAISFRGIGYIAEELTEESFDDKQVDIALFSAGATVSRKFAPIAASKGVVVVDNSSAWRMDPDVPLVVPEVNPQDVLWNKGIIANPNCSTTQAVVPLKPLHDKYRINRIIYSTYQAVSGTGAKGIEDLAQGLSGNDLLLAYPHPIAGNCLPHIGAFLENGYTEEEIKMINETQRILGDDSIRITVTTVRVPVFGSHSETINLEFERPFELEDVRALLESSPGCMVVDDPANNLYPLARQATGQNEVLVGRIRRDFSVKNGLNLWVVADNIRKGAATNAVQIAELLIK